MQRTRTLVVIACLTCASVLAPVPRASAASWRDDVAALLARRARTVLSGDRVAFDATMASAPAAFRAQRDRWFARISSLPIGSYTLTLAPDGYGDLAAATRARSVGREEHIVEAVERIAFAGYDARPGAHELFLTVARIGARWSVVADDDLEDLGMLSSRDLWDFGDVHAQETSGVLVLFHRDARAAAGILRETIAAVARVRRAWPYPWRARVVVMVPSTSAELARILQTTFDLDPFIAFTAADVERPDGGFAMGGVRVYVQPDTFFRTSARFRRDVLGHELLHLATRSVAGFFTPVWAEEGVAQVYGERSRHGTSTLRAAVRARPAFPPDWEFTVGSRREIRRAYEASASVIRWLGERYGHNGGARLYRAIGAESPLAFGTRRYHLDHASREALGIPFASLERRWVRWAQKEYG